MTDMTCKNTPLSALLNHPELTCRPMSLSRHNNNSNGQPDLIDMSVPFQQTGFQPQFASFNPYAAQQQEEMMRAQQMEQQRQQVCSWFCINLPT